MERLLWREIGVTQNNEVTATPPQKKLRREILPANSRETGSSARIDSPRKPSVLMSN